MTTTVFLLAVWLLMRVLYYLLAYYITAVAVEIISNSKSYSMDEKYRTFVVAFIYTLIMFDTLLLFAKALLY